jgi:hypothetical protein
MTATFMPRNPIRNIPALASDSERFVTRGDEVHTSAVYKVDALYRVEAEAMRVGTA